MWNRICEKKKLWIVLDSPQLNVAPPADLPVDFLVELHVDLSADLLVDLCVDPNVDLGVELAASPIERSMSYASYAGLLMSVCHSFVKRCLYLI